MKSFQDWCVDTLVYILSHKNEYCGNLLDQGYKYTIDAIIKHFASMVYCANNGIAQKDKEHINLAWNQLSKKRMQPFFAKLMMSRKAYGVVHSKGLSVKSAKKQLHLEHITPCAEVYRKLFEAKKGDSVSRESVKRCFEDCKLVLIHRDEKSYLDDANVKFEQQDLDYINKNFPKSKKSASAHFEDSPKDGGTALLRLARLKNKGVEFCTYGGEEMGPKQWQDYLNDNSFNIE